MNVLDALLFGVRNILYAGASMPTRSAVNVHGAGVVVTDDVANERTDIEIPGSGPGAGLTVTAVKTANYTAAIGELVRVDATAGDITIEAPTAVGHADERWGVLRVEPTLPVSHTVTLDAADSINDEGTRPLALARSCCILRSDGATWRVESEFLDVTVSDATPAGVSTSGSAGTSTALARGDHAHALTYAVVQSAIGGASSALGLNAQRITGVADPVSDQDAATKAYVLANAGGGGSALQTGADIDYASIGAGTPQDFIALGGDGTYTIGGRAHAVLNSANAAKLELDASGLTGRDSANTNWPVIHLPLSTLAPAVSLARHEAWILARLKLSAGTPGGGTFLRMALDFEAWVAANTANRYMYQQAGYQGGAHYLAIGAAGTVGGEFAVSSSLIASDQVVAWQISGGGRLVNFYSMAWGGSWPSPDDFAQDATTLLTHSTYAWTPSSATLRLAWNDTTGSSAEWSLPRIQVLYQ